MPLWNDDLKHFIKTIPCLIKSSAGLLQGKPRGTVLLVTVPWVTTLWITGQQEVISHCLSLLTALAPQKGQLETRPCGQKGQGLMYMGSSLVAVSEATYADAIEEMLSGLRQHKQYYVQSLTRIPVIKPVVKNSIPRSTFEDLIGFYLETHLTSRRALPGAVLRGRFA